MCGIWAVFGMKKEDFYQCRGGFDKIDNRGPESWRLQHEKEMPNAYLGFHRLHIINPEGSWGNQPMKVHSCPTATLMCNGEIYNYKKLVEELSLECSYELGSDVECILPLYKEYGYEKCAQLLDGVFAFCIVDSMDKSIYLGRDPFGVRPLFRLVSQNILLAISSEVKGLIDVARYLCRREKYAWKVEHVPPGHVVKYVCDPRDGYKAKFVEQIKYYEMGERPKFHPFIPYNTLITNTVQGNIAGLLTAAVDKRLMAHRRIGCFLSGGLDSSLIAALLMKLCRNYRRPQQFHSYPIQSFSIGMVGSPDLIAAKLVADYIGTEHHEVVIAEHDVIRSIDAVIYQLETADVTTVRASIGMHLISDYVKRCTSTRVIFSGEGADELCQGYIYFRDAPSATEAHAESARLLRDIHLYDGLRADRTTAAHGLEIRVPFLDLEFSHYYLGLPKEARQPHEGVEKYLLRSAFDETDLLPKSILWRHKEAFSDGITNKKCSLFEIIQNWVENEISDGDLTRAPELYPHLTPKTKEALYYRRTLEKYYGPEVAELTPYYWMPKWCEAVSDPSARFIPHYSAK